MLGVDIKEENDDRFGSSMAMRPQSMSLPSEKQFAFNQVNASIDVLQDKGLLDINFESQENPMGRSGRLSTSMAEGLHGY